MEARLRLATEEDDSTFVEMWKAFLIEHEKLGSDMRATKRTLDFFRMLFDSYTSQAIPGVVLLAFVEDDPAGALIWGGLPHAPFDRVNESIVNGWGAYTKPEYRRRGLSRALRERALLELHERGIAEVLGSAILTNTPGIESSRVVGFKPTSINGTVKVADEVAKIRQREAKLGGHGAMTDGFYWEGLCPLCGKE